MLRHLAVRAGWDDRQDASDQQALPEAITIDSFGRAQRLGRSDGDIHEWLGCGVFGGLAAGQVEAERQALFVAAGVDFARKATS